MSEQFRLDPKDPTSVYKIKKDAITKSFLIDTFAIKNDASKALIPSNTRFVVDDKLVKEFDSPLAKFKNYKDLIGQETTVGRLVCNIFVMDIEFNNKDFESLEYNDNLMAYVNYINAPFNKKVVGSIDNSLADLFIDGVFASYVLEDYINKMQWLGYTSSIMTLPSLDLKTVNPSKDIRKFRDTKLKESKDIIASKDVLSFSKVESEILNYAGNKLNEEGATGKFIYDSGFNGDFTNNYKVTSLFRGIAPKSDSTDKFDIATSNLVDGVTKNDLASHADLAVLGAAGRAKDTQLGGYKTKIFNAAFASIVSSPKGTDCKTTGLLDVNITEDNFRSYRYRNIVEGGKLVNLTPDLKSKYVGKTVKMRSIMFCNMSNPCNVCLGDMFYRLHISNIGLHNSRVTSTLMNLSMKSFHNMSVKPKSYSIFDYIK